MTHERANKASDDGVSYEDGDVVYGGNHAEEPTTSAEIMTLWSPALCDVPKPTQELAPLSLTDPARLKDGDDAKLIGRAISDVDEYLGTDYPTYLS